MKYDLVIYIPTFNRPVAIKKQTNTIEASILKLQSKLNIRVVVQDNCSPQAVDIYCNSIEFRSNGINIGGNANIANGFAVDYIKDSRYLWILSDNDFLSDKFLNELSIFLQSDSYDFIIFDKDIKKPQSDKVEKSDYKYIWHKGLISNCIYATKNLHEHGMIPYLFHNSSFPHLAMAFTILNEKQSIDYCLVPKSSIFLGQESSELIADYSFSEIAMPLLIEVMHGRYSFIFALKWLAKSNFKKNKKNKQFNFVKDNSAQILRRKLKLLYWPVLYISKIYQILRMIRRIWLQR
jgi:hypothetical protein